MQSLVLPVMLRWMIRATIIQSDSVPATVRFENRKEKKNMSTFMMLITYHSLPLLHGKLPHSPYGSPVVQPGIREGLCKMVLHVLYVECKLVFMCSLCIGRYTSLVRRVSPFVIHVKWHLIHQCACVNSHGVCGHGATDWEGYNQKEEAHHLSVNLQQLSSDWVAM